MGYLSNKVQSERIPMLNSGLIPHLLQHQRQHKPRKCNKSDRQKKPNEPTGATDEVLNVC